MTKEMHPLTGVRVLDFSHYLAGPLASMIFADAGAEVIKVEKPGGDDMRYFAPREASLGGEGPAFLWANRNKRSIVIDLRHEQGQRIARELAMTADVVLENFSVGVMAKYGLDHERLQAINPRLIYCSVSAFGPTGSLARRPGFDTMMQAESGFMSLNGYPDRDGVRTGPAVMDIGTAMMASNAVLLALLARERTGVGQKVDVSLFDTAMLMTGYAAMQYLFSGRLSARTGNSSPDVCPNGVFLASDGPILITCSSTGLFRRLFIEALAMPEIGDDPELQTAGGRLAHRERIDAALHRRIATASREHWMTRFAAIGIPAGAVRTLAEALESPEVAERRLVSHIPHPTAGQVPNLRLPIELGATPLVEPVAAPLLGQHTDQILAEVLGYDEAARSAIRASGALGMPPAAEAGVQKT